MPFAYKLFDDIELIYVFGYGPVTGAEFVDLNAKISRDERRTPHQAWIVDVADVASLDVSLREMRALVANDLNEVATGIYTGEQTVVVTIDLVYASLARLYSVLMRGRVPPVQTVSTIERALDLLGLREAAPEVCAVRAAYLDPSSTHTASAVPSSSKKWGMGNRRLVPLPVPRSMP